MTNLERAEIIRERRRGQERARKAADLAKFAKANEASLTARENRLADEATTEARATYRLRSMAARIK